jgi:hypothetical protein
MEEVEPGEGRDMLGEDEPRVEMGWDRKLEGASVSSKKRGGRPGKQARAQPT